MQTLKIDTDDPTQFMREVIANYSSQNGKAVNPNIVVLQGKALEIFLGMMSSRTPLLPYLTGRIGIMHSDKTRVAMVVDRQNGLEARISHDGSDWSRRILGRAQRMANFTRS